MQDFLAQYFMTLGVIGIIWYVLEAIALWRMFSKAHVAGWKALIPFYNLYILYKISWEPKIFWYNILIAIIGGICSAFDGGFFYYLGLALDFISAIIIAVLWYNVSISYGHGLPFFLGLYFLNPIFILILAFGSSQYVGNRYKMQG